jgi:glycine C-acetyltransferase
MRTASAMMGEMAAAPPMHQGVQDDVDIYFGTFAKAMATIGAFISGPEDMMMYMRYNMRSQTFAKSLPMPIVIGALKRLEMIRTRPEFSQKLWTITNALQSGLKECRLDIGKDQQLCHARCYMKGSVPEATNVVVDLRENHGIFCSIVVYPVIPKDEILLRLIPTAAHSMEDVERTIQLQGSEEEAGEWRIQGRQGGGNVIGLLKM